MRTPLIKKDSDIISIKVYDNDDTDAQHPDTENILIESEGTIQYYIENPKKTYACSWFQRPTFKSESKDVNCIEVDITWLDQRKENLN